MNEPYVRADRPSPRHQRCIASVRLYECHGASRCPCRLYPAPSARNAVRDRQNVVHESHELPMRSQSRQYTHQSAQHCVKNAPSACTLRSPPHTTLPDCAGQPQSSAWLLQPLVLLVFHIKYACLPWPPPAQSDSGGRAEHRSTPHQLMGHLTSFEGQPRHCGYQTPSPVAAKNSHRNQRDLQQLHHAPALQSHITDAGQPNLHQQ